MAFYQPTDLSGWPQTPSAGSHNSPGGVLTPLTSLQTLMSRPLTRRADPQPPQAGPPTYLAGAHTYQTGLCASLPLLRNVPLQIVLP